MIALLFGAPPKMAIAAPAGPAQLPGVSVNPTLELLAGVQAQTDWVIERGPQGSGSEYYQALKEFFTPYRDHEAVRISAELLRNGFSYDAPVGFVCHLGPLPELALKNEYSDYLANRAGGRDQLERFRVALQRLATESRFAEFVAQWQPKYDEWAGAAAAALDRDAVVGWLTDFFRTDAVDFRFFLAPAMYPGGGYGATLQAADGTLLAYQIIRANPGAEREPQFNLQGGNLNDLAVHEWGHSFVNPAVAASSDRIAEVERFYQPVASTMKNQAYGGPQVYFSEQVLRAVETLAMADLRSADAAERAVTYNEGRGFHMTAQISEYLRREYVPNAAQYPTFTAFMPTLLDWLKTQPVPGGGMMGRVLPWVIVGGAATVIATSLAASRRRQRRDRGEAVATSETE